MKSHINAIVIAAIFLFNPLIAQEITHIKKIAKEKGYGYKTANLYELKKLISDSKLQMQLLELNCTARVPIFYGIASWEIISYLYQNGFDLSNEWNKFINSISDEEKNKMIEDKKISVQFALGLREFQEKIKSVFHLKTFCKFFSNKEWLNFIENSSCLIVRSTAMEDRIGLTNAGGNVSIKDVSAILPDILTAMGEVVASYFSEKSMGQRLLIDGSNLFTLPLTAVLIQQMVKDSIRPLEAVIHTSEQSGPTPGCISCNLGYDVVDSKNRSDMYYYFPSKSGFALLAKQVNHISENCRIAIQIIAQEIEKHYQQPTDIELLITQNPDESHVIHLVQARPINRFVQSRKPDFITNILEIPKKHILQTQTVVAAGSYTRFIENEEQVIIAPTLKEAENIYLFETDKKNEIKAVIVEKEAEPNSHEATTFAECNVLVMCVRDPDQLVSFMEFGSFILDPQQALIVSINNNQPIINEGFISHPMTQRVSIEKQINLNMPFEIKDYFPQSDLNTLFLYVKRSKEKDAIHALSSLLFRLEKEKDLVQKNTSKQELGFVKDTIAQLEDLYVFAKKKAIDAIAFLKLPSNDLKRLAIIKPLEAAFFQEEDLELENIFSLQSVLKKYFGRMNFYENCLKTFPSQSIIILDPNLLDAIKSGYDAAMTSKVKKLWLNFVQENSNKLGKLSEMINDLTNLDALSSWMQIVFPLSDNFNDFYLEYKEALPLLEQLKNLQNQLVNVSVSDWARPEKFDFLLKRTDYFLNFLLSDEFLNVFDESKKLKQIAALSFMGTFVDTFDDKFIKTMLQSSYYSSSEKVQNFKMIVKKYFSILKRWELLSTLTDDAKKWALADFLDDLKRGLPTFYSMVDKENFNLIEYISNAENLPEEGFEELPEEIKEMLHIKYPSMSLKQAGILFTKERFKNVETFQNYLEKMKQEIEQTNLSSKQLFPPRNFSVASSIFVNVAKTACPSNFDNYTLAAFFTLIHQNINSILTNISMQIGLDQFKRPKLLQDIEVKINQIGYMPDETGQLKNPSLIGVKCISTSLRLIYNLPIKQHGVTYDIIYNCSTKDVKIVINLVNADNNLSAITKFFNVGAKLLKTTNIATFISGRDVHVSCTLDNMSEIEHLDIFLQAIHELTSEHAKDLNNKIYLQNTTRFMNFFEETNKQKFLAILNEL